jgi:hypothetical protein
MCTTRMNTYLACRHDTYERVLCHQRLSGSKDKCNKNTFQDTYHNLCPRCSGTGSIATSKPETRPEYRMSDDSNYQDDDVKSSSNSRNNTVENITKQANEDVVIVSSPRKDKAMDGIKNVMDIVRRRTHRKRTSDAEGNENIEGSMDESQITRRDEEKSAEEWAEEYRALLDVHPFLLMRDGIGMPFDAESKAKESGLKIATAEASAMPDLVRNKEELTARRPNGGRTVKGGETRVGPKEVTTREGIERMARRAAKIAEAAEKLTGKREDDIVEDDGGRMVDRKAVLKDSDRILMTVEQDKVKKAVQVSLSPY